LAAFLVVGFFFEPENACLTERNKLFARFISCSIALKKIVSAPNGHRDWLRRVRHL
jgi:hypothetical protein